MPSMTPADRLFAAIWARPKMGRQYAGGLECCRRRVADEWHRGISNRAALQSHNAWSARRSDFARVPTSSDGVLLRPGALARNAIYGPGTKQLDLSLSKTFLFQNVRRSYSSE